MTMTPEIRALLEKQQREGFPPSPEPVRQIPETHWQRLKDHDERIAKLEAFIAEMGGREP
jgi:hypothetical protein